MQKKIALELRDKAFQIADNFSRADREFNVNNEEFKVDKIEPLSETTAIVTFKKSSGKVGLAFCYYIRMNGGLWNYFFPTYDHCVGMERVKEMLFDIEKLNFFQNFKQS